MFPKRALLTVTALTALALAGAAAVTAQADTPPTEEPAGTAPPETAGQDAADPPDAVPEADTTTTAVTAAPAISLAPDTSAPPPESAFTAVITVQAADQPVPDSALEAPLPAVGDAVDTTATAVSVAVPEPVVELSAPPATTDPATTDVATPATVPTPVGDSPSPPSEEGPPVEAGPPPAPPEPADPAPTPEPPSAPIDPAPPIDAAPPPPPASAAASIPAVPVATPEVTSHAASANAALDHAADTRDPAFITAEAATPTPDVEASRADPSRSTVIDDTAAPRASGQPPLAPFPNGGQPLAATWVSGSVVGPVVGPEDGSLRLTFPVLGPVRYSDGWGNPRGAHGERRHEGTDLLGVAGQPLRAVFDGVVTRYQLEDRGISGAVITITRSDGLRANYFHINTADLATGRRDAAPASWRIPTAVRLGSRVTAGQIVGFMGDSGNATGVPHLHFELRTPDGVPFNPYPALAAAEARERCTVVFGPWANVGTVTDVPVLPVVEIDGPDGAIWQLTARGEVVATTSAAATVGHGCDRTRLVP